MKVVGYPTTEKPKGHLVLPLMVEGSMTPLTKDNSVGLSLRIEPTNANSVTFKMQILVLTGGETVRDCVNWYRDWDKVQTGLHLTTAPGRSQMLRSMMKGTALSLFNAKLDEEREKVRETRALAAEEGSAAQRRIRESALDHADNFTLAAVTATIKSLLKSLMPRKVLARAKRQLRREMRKPNGMKIRDWFHMVRSINTGELPLLPPDFSTDQSLDDEELIDVVLFSNPKSWYKEMDRQGFDPFENTVDDVIAFMERMESAEEFDANAKQSSNSNNKSKGKTGNSSKGGRSTGNSSSKYCKYHGVGNHSTDDCTFIEKMVAQKKSKTNGSNTNGHSHNRSWKRTADSETSKSKNDLAAFIAQAVKEGVQQEMAAFNKRSADDEELDLNALETQLNDLNYGSHEEGEVEEDDASTGNISC